MESSYTQFDARCYKGSEIYCACSYALFIFLDLDSGSIGRVVGPLLDGHGLDDGLLLVGDPLAEALQQRRVLLPVEVRLVYKFVLQELVLLRGVSVVQSYKGMSVD